MTIPRTLYCEVWISEHWKDNICAAKSSQRQVSGKHQLHGGIRKWQPKVSLAHQNRWCFFDGTWWHLRRRRSSIRWPRSGSVAKSSFWWPRLTPFYISIHRCTHAHGVHKYMSLDATSNWNKAQLPPTYSEELGPPVTVQPLLSSWIDTISRHPDLMSTAVLWVSVPSVSSQ